MSEPGQFLQRMRDAAPLVHNITNYVSMNFMANVLLAAGGSPAMVHAIEEAGEFAGIAQAVTVNIGTLSAPWVEAMRQAAGVAAGKGTPWVLDPVAAGATGYRRRVAGELLTLRPTVLRGNASEIIALGGAAAAGKGVDAADGVEAASAAAKALAQQTGGVVAVSGAEDLVTDGTRTARIANGHPMMAQVTATGCALTGVVGAFLATGGDAFDATVAAFAFYGLAGERAAATAAGPGSFAVAFVDRLSGIDGAALEAGAKVRTS